MEIAQFKTYAFVLAAALGYALATVGMKLAAGSATNSGNWTLLALALLLLGFWAATHSEMTLMREVHLGALYLLIIAVETLVVLGYAWLIGEGLAGRDLMGGLLILAGVLVIGH